MTPQRRAARVPIPEWLANVTSADGLFAVDPEQRITHWSSAAESTLGYTAEEMVGTPCYEAIGGRDRRNLRFCRRDCPVTVNARRGCPTPHYDILVRSKAGSDVWINLSILILGAEGRASNTVVHLFRDVTQRRLVEDRVQKAMASLRKFVHEDTATAGEQADPAPTPLPPLTRREMEVLRLLASGLSTPQIAEDLGVSPITARNHLASLLNKLGAKNRLQAVLFASQHQLV